MSRYTCFGGYMPCNGKCRERKCSKFCLCTEVVFCFGISVASTRFMFQDKFNIKTTKCDNCIIGCMVCLQQVACVFSIITSILGSDELNDASQLLNCLADMVLHDEYKWDTRIEKVLRSCFTMLEQRAHEALCLNWTKHYLST